MAKLTNVRERVHQPFRDTLCRTAGMSRGNVLDNTALFTLSGKNEAETNFHGTGSALSSDQSHVTLALRVFVWMRNPYQRGPTVSVSGGIDYAQANGDFQFAGAGSTWSAAQSRIANGNAPGTVQDVHRLHWQCAEQLLWSFGTGEKFSLTSIPTAYLPFGGGLHGDLGGATDIVLWNNGMPSHSGILRLARAILIPPRQNVKALALIVAMSDPNEALFGASQGSRNVLSLRDNLNAVDLIQKNVALWFDGLYSRDVQ